MLLLFTTEESLERELLVVAALIENHNIKGKPHHF
jgi:hypothetical protein